MSDGIAAADGTGGLVSAVLKGLRWAASNAVPERWRQEAAERLAEHNPFDVIEDRHDLIRALRIAWIRAALTVLRSADWTRAADPPETLRFRALARQKLRAIRFDAFDHRGHAGTTPIDKHRVDLSHHSSAVGPHPLTTGFGTTLAEIVGWPTEEVPPVFTGAAIRGVRTFPTAEPRDFAALVLDAFGDLLVNPKRYRQAGQAFQIDMMNAARVLGEQTLQAVQGLDDRMTVGLDATITALRTNLRKTVDESLRPWFEVQDYGGAVPSNSPGARRAFRQRPTNMLVARYRIVPFLDRDGILAEALAWATNPDEETFPGRLYVAPGGFGKTRLALELTETLRDQGWRCRFLSRQNAEDLVSGALPDLLRDEAARGVLLVFDYAESQADLLKKAAVTVDATESTVPIRLLALARSPEGWWDGLSREDAMARVFDPTPFRTIEDRLSPQDQTALLDDATTAFTQALANAGEAPPEGGAKRYDLSGRDFDRPLMVAMAAFLGARGIVANPEQSLLSHMFHQEQSLWKRALGPNVPDNDRGLALLQGAAAQITLVQGASTSAAGTLLAALRMGQDYGAPARDTALAALARIYGTETDAGVFRHPIQPDILGEHVALRVAETVHTDLIEATMRAALAGPPLHPQDPGLILTVLVRALRPEHDTPYSKHGSTVQQIAATAIDRIASLVPTLPHDEILRLAAALPRFALPLLDLSLAVARRAVDTATDPSEQAAAQNDLGIRLSETGDRAGALEPARRAVEIREQLARENPAAYLPGLANSLNNLAALLSGTGDRAGALEPARRAVEINEQLAGANPAAHLPGLATSLNNLANHLGENGDRAAALEPARRAVEIREQLARSNPVAHLPGLANSLNNLAIRLGENGDRTAALVPARRAVKIYEQLARENPAAYLPDHATSLNNLANTLSETGDRARALEPARYSVEIREQLARENPAAYLPVLATSLNNLANRMSEAGDRAGALELARRAIEINEQLARENPAAYLPVLATSLKNLAIRQGENGDRAGALIPARRAVDIGEQLARANPAAYLPDLANSLNNLANRLSETGDRAGALEPARRAVDIGEQLASANPAAYLPVLATHLNSLATVLSRTGDHVGALELARRAVEINEQLARENQSTYLPELASSLNNLANRLSETGDRAGALEPARRAVEIGKQLARENQAAHLSVLGGRLNNLASHLSLTGDYTGAQEPARLAIEMYEQLARANPAAYLPDLATSLGVMGDVTRAAGDLGAAVTAFTDSLTAFRTCFYSLPQRFGPYLAAVAERLADALVQAGRGAEVEPTLRAVLGDSVYQAMMQERAATAPSPAAEEARRLLEGFVAAFNDAVSARDATKGAAAMGQAAALDRHLAEHAGDASLGPLLAHWAGIKQQIGLGSAEGDGESDAG